MNKVKEKNRILKVLLSTQAISLVGTRATSIALGIWLFKSTGKAADILLIAFFTELPAMLFGQFVGMAVDRYDRKKIMILSDLGQAIGSLALLITILSGSFEIWHLYIIVFMQGVLNSLQETSNEASIALLVDDSNRIRINAVKELAFPTAGVFAPVIGGLLLTFTGVEGVIAFDILTFMIGMMALFSIDIPRIDISITEKEDSITSYQRITAGIRFLYREKGLLLIVIYIGVVNFVINGPLELVMPYLLLKTNSEITLTFFMGLMSASTMIGALMLTRVKVALSSRSLLGFSIITTGIGLVLFGITDSRFGLAITLMITMMPLPIMNIAFRTMLQKNTPPEVQGRVFALVFQLAYGTAPLSFALLGPLVDRYVNPMVVSRDIPYINAMVGNSPWSGMGLVFLIAGLMLIIITIAMHINKTIKSYD